MRVSVCPKCLLNGILTQGQYIKRVCEEIGKAYHRYYCSECDDFYKEK